ncbi:low molecular weight phosphotyrosine protein phosphatase [Trichomonascus vanleenenianus]|uniref:tyrosine protein phosphatase LTP1 n=1 Tax=Trichomonascus vanleenenianus TaxID=2268995 RepID=UPI003ECB1A9E
MPLNLDMTNSDSNKISVAFVCLGNICRSPMAEAVFAHTVKQRGLEGRFEVIDSFGTGAYHLGELPDRRSRGECKKHGVPVNHRAQQIDTPHFNQFDYILAMDEMNYEDLQDMAPRSSRAKIQLFGEYRTDKTFARIVSDPYYGGLRGFEINFDQLTHFSNVFLDQAVSK